MFGHVLIHLGSLAFINMECGIRHMFFYVNMPNEVGVWQYATSVAKIQVLLVMFSLIVPLPYILYYCRFLPNYDLGLMWMCENIKEKILKF